MRYEEANAIAKELCSLSVPSHRPRSSLGAGRATRRIALDAPEEFAPRVWAWLVRLGEGNYDRQGPTGEGARYVSAVVPEQAKPVEPRPAPERPLPSFGRAMMPPRMELPAASR